MIIFFIFKKGIINMDKIFHQCVYSEFSTTSLEYGHTSFKTKGERALYQGL